MYGLLMKRSYFLIVIFLLNTTLYAKKEVHHLSDAASKKNATETILVPAAARSKDIVEAFQFFKKVSKASQIDLKLTSGAAIENIIQMTPMENGTIIIIQKSTVKGERYEAINIEDIAAIEPSR